MYLGIKEVQPLKDYKLKLTFENGEEKIFDLKPYLHVGRFSELRNPALFQKVRVSFDAIEWPNGLDLDPEFLYRHSQDASRESKPLRDSLLKPGLTQESESKGKAGRF